MADESDNTLKEGGIRLLSPRRNHTGENGVWILHRVQHRMDP